METVSQIDTERTEPTGAEVVEELPEWRVDSTFQLRVNNVCSKLIRRGVRPTYQRVRANIGEPPARMLREAMQAWASKILPTLYAAPKVEWAERPRAISPKVAELFEEMWMLAVAAAQVHYEMGEDASSRLTHRETIDMVCHELRRLNGRVRAIENSALRVEEGIRKGSDFIAALEADLIGLQNLFALELDRVKSMAESLDSFLVRQQAQSEKQIADLKTHLEACALDLRLDPAKNTKVRRIAKKRGRSRSPTR